MAKVGQSTAVRLDSKARIEIDKIVKTEDLTVSQVIRRAVREYLDKRKKGERRGK
jgi:metal-responsive CopG/Arc/MetJ family transcriptional regulator